MADALNAKLNVETPDSAFPLPLKPNISMAQCINWGRIYNAATRNPAVFFRQDCNAQLYKIGWTQWCEAEESLGRAADGNIPTRRVSEGQSFTYVSGRGGKVSSAALLSGVYPEKEAV